MLPLLFIALFSVQDPELIYIRRATREASREASLSALRTRDRSLRSEGWWILGPFENRGGKGMTQEGVPERGVDLQTPVKGSRDEDLRWQAAPRFVDGNPHQISRFGRTSNVLCYLTRKIQSARTRIVLLNLQADDHAILWVNGRKAYETKRTSLTPPPADGIPIRLRRGENRLLLKLGNVGGAWSFRYELLPWSPQLLTRLDARLDRDFPRTGEAAHYRIERITIPDEIVLEVGGLAFLPNGALAIGTRRGEIWLRKGEEWKRFASGLHEILGLDVGKDGALVVSQRPELTRVRDLDGDGVADDYETLSAAWGLSGNYFEYTFGPVRDRKGNLFGSLALGREAGSVSRAPYRGWVFRLGPDGRFAPFASGFRSPSGMGVSPDGKLFVADSQGDWLASSALYHVEEGSFYGHPAGLKWEKGYRGPEDSRNLPKEKLEERRRYPAVWLPHSRVGTSAGQPLWDTTKGKFGPFAGQLFVLDYSFSQVNRVMLHEVDGVVQGAVVPFRSGLSTGLIRGAFGPDGALWVGGTDRGWGSRGGKPFALDRIVWTGRVPFEVKDVQVRAGSRIHIELTRPILPTTAHGPQAAKIRRFRYLYHGEYGSPEVDSKPVPVRKVSMLPGGRSIECMLGALEPRAVYEITLEGLRSASNVALEHPTLYLTVVRLSTK